MDWFCLRQVADGWWLGLRLTAVWVLSFFSRLTVLNAEKALTVIVLTHHSDEVPNKEKRNNSEKLGGRQNR